MRGYLRSATVIEACDRCYALRDTKSEPGECKSCRALLNISFNKVHMLSFGDVTSDEPLQPEAYQLTRWWALDDTCWPQGTA